jgi:hypothetical protein
MLAHGLEQREQRYARAQSRKDVHGKGSGPF